MLKNGVGMPKSVARLVSAGVILVALILPITMGGCGNETDSDRDALVALYNATDGASWRDNTNWLSDEPIGEWFGVTTAPDGRVVELDLSLNQLSGGIPSELGRIANLEELILGFNQLSGEIPSELGGLENLEVLYLTGNQLSGLIPPELGLITNLQRLFIEGNQLSGPIPPELQPSNTLPGAFIGEEIGAVNMHQLVVERADSDTAKIGIGVGQPQIPVSVEPRREPVDRRDPARTGQPYQSVGVTPLW